MSDVLTDLSPSALAEAIQANYFQFLATQRLWPGAEFHEEPGVLWTISDVPSPTFNFVLPVHLSPDKIDSTIESTLARYRERKVTPGWRFGSTSTPANLGKRLEEHGFVLKGDEPGMALELMAMKEDIPTSSEITIERVADLQTLRLYGQVSSIGFRLPEFVLEPICDWFTHVGLNENSPVQHYLGWLSGEPVATSTLFFGAGVAGIHRVATLPQARGRGIGASMTLAPLREARARGYRVAALHASPMGVNIYHRMGFQEYCRIISYALEG